MASSPGGGFGWKGDRHRDQEEEEEEEEEEECERHVSQNGEDGLGSNMDQWDLSFSQENLEEAGLLKELKAYQDRSAEEEQSFDLGKLRDFKHGREADHGSPPPDNGDYQDHDGIQEDLSPVSYWQLQINQRLRMTEKKQDGDSSGRLEKQAKAWEAGSDGEAYPELSYEGQYGSECSASPEALRDPLTSYKHGKSNSFTSDSGEDFSNGSNVSPSPSRDPPDHIQLRIEAFEAQSLFGDSSEFPEETEFSSPSARSPESRILSSSADSTHWTRNLLGRLSVEDLQNSPGIDAETFPESSYVDEVGEPMGIVVKVDAASTARATKRYPSSTAKPKEGLLDAVGRMKMPRDTRQVGNRPSERARRLKANVPHGLPSKFSRQSRSLSPQGRATQKKPSSHELGPASQVTPIANNALPYGRGQLNYPLPDFSKVEPRVRFPKDPQAYHPPRGKSPARSKGSGRPVIFKSPAEIVREVLLSSGEGSPQKCPTPMDSVIPDELKSPRQATELVQQLQEDYHKLLTKYAEAENTIDRLRLGAKSNMAIQLFIFCSPEEWAARDSTRGSTTMVLFSLEMPLQVRLYADPPKPHQGVQMGTMSQGTKVMTFSIPQIRAAEVAGGSGPVLDATSTQVAGPLRQQAESSPPDSVDAAGPRADGFTSTENPFSGDHLTQVLAAQARKFQSQVESLEELIRIGRLMPQDQLKAFARLKEAQGALERTYLQAREEHRQLQKQPPGVLGDFDPDRTVEGEIFRLEMRLEELKERIDQATQPAPWRTPEAAVAPDYQPAEASDTQMGSPTPSIKAPVPVVRTPYPQAPIAKDSPGQVQIAVEVSSISDEAEEYEEGLPEPLCLKQLQVEKDFDNLLDHYSSFKSLPEAMSLEQLHLHNHSLSPEPMDRITAKDAGTKDNHHRKVSEDNETIRRSSSKQLPKRMPPELPPQKTIPVSSIQVEESIPRRLAEECRPSPAVPRKSSGRQQVLLSPQGSTASLRGSATSERAARKSFPKTNVALSEDLRIVSPETDSGFVGSEASRVSPLAQLPKPRSSRCRSHRMLGKLPPKMLDSDGLLQLASRRIEPAAAEPLTVTEVSARHAQPEGGTQRHSVHSGSSFQMGSPPQWTNSIASEIEPGTDSTHTDSEGEVHGRISTYKAHPDEMRHSSSFSATSLSPATAPWHSLLDSRLEREDNSKFSQRLCHPFNITPPNWAVSTRLTLFRKTAKSCEKTLSSMITASSREILHEISLFSRTSQAIMALKNEVSQLRQSLEETLHRPHGHPKQSSSPRASVTRLSFQGSTRIPKSASLMGKNSGQDTVGSEEPCLETKPEGWERRSSFPPNETQLDLSPSESDCSPPKPQESKSQEAASSRTEAQKQSILKGPYTGTQYPLSTPLSPKPKVQKRPDSCPHCQEVKSQPGEEPMSEPKAWEAEGYHLPSGDSFKSSHHSTQKTGLCPLCKDTKNHRSKLVHGVDHSREPTSSQDHSEEKKRNNRQQPQQPGLWYWALPSPAASVGYVPTVPLATCLPASVIYCSPPAPTSASSPAGVPVNISTRDQAAAQRNWSLGTQPQEGRSWTLNFDEMQDLSWALNRAIEAAKGVKLTTKRMSRSLTSELSKTRSLRGSCLF